MKQRLMRIRGTEGKKTESEFQRDTDGEIEWHGSCDRKKSRRDDRPVMPCERSRACKIKDIGTKDEKEEGVEGAGLSEKNDIQYTVVGKVWVALVIPVTVNS